MILLLLFLLTLLLGDSRVSLIAVKLHSRHTGSGVTSLKFPFFYSDFYRDTSKTRARFILSDRHTGMTLDEIRSDLWRV